MELDYIGEPMPVFAVVTLFCLYVISILVGLCGSGLVIFTLASDNRFRHDLATYVNYLINLVGCDLFFQLYFFPTLAAGLLAGRYPVLDHAHCVVNGFVFFTSSIVFMFTLVAISVDRYTCVCKLTLHRRYFFRKNSRIACVVMWLLAGLVCVPSAVDGTIGYDPKTRMCFLRDQGTFTLGHAVTVAVVALTLVGVGVPNALIFRAYRASRRRVGNHTDSPPNDGRTGVLQDQQQQQQALKISRNDIALLRSLLTVFVAFFVLTFPATVVFILRRNVYISPFLYGLFIWLYAVNSSINWIIYGLMNYRFRTGYMRALKRMRQCCTKA